MGKSEAAAELGRLGGKARAKALSAERRQEIATRASKATKRYQAKRAAQAPDEPLHDVGQGDG